MRVLPLFFLPLAIGGSSIDCSDGSETCRSSDDVVDESALIGLRASVHAQKAKPTPVLQDVSKDAPGGVQDALTDASDALCDVIDAACKQLFKVAADGADEIECTPDKAKAKKNCDALEIDALVDACVTATTTTIEDACLTAVKAGETFGVNDCESAVGCA